jgi:hypothetical protein
MLTKIQVDSLQIKKLAQLNRLFIGGKTRCGKSFLAKRIAFCLSESHSVYVFHPYLPFERDFIPFPYQDLPLINFRFFRSDRVEELLEEIKGINRLDKNSKPKAIILDELCFNNSNILIRSLSTFDNSEKIIVISQAPKIIFPDWDNYSKLFGELGTYFKLEITDFLDKRTKFSLPGSNKRQDYLAWREALSSQDKEINDRCWLFERVA